MRVTTYAWKHSIIIRSKMCFLEQYIILEEDGHSVYRNWNRVYNRDSIESVLLDEKLIPTGIYGDIGGRAYDEKSDTICMIAKKQKK